MADRFEVAQRFLSSLKPTTDGSVQPATDLLTEAVTFQLGMTKLSGRDAVIQRLASPEADKFYQQVDWSSPRVNSDAIQVDGSLPPGSAVGAVVVLFYFAGDQIALIQQQNIAGPPPAPTPLKLTPELQDLVNNALTTRHPILVAAVLENGQPFLGYRGSTHVFSDDQLAFWARHSDGNFVRSIAKNPRVTLFYRDAETRTMLQFMGRARVADDPSTRNKIYDGSPEPERNADFARLGMAVLVDLDRVEGSFALAPGGRVLMVRT